MAKKEAADRRREILEALRQADEALHLSYPPGGNANHERATQKLAELRKLVEEE
jgi:hypothetical protein